MPNIAALLKDEIARVARKEVRPLADAIKKQASSHRSEVAALKRRVQELERQLKAASRKVVRDEPAKATPASSEGNDATGLRFRPAGMASNRQRLGLSAADFGLLIGATGQSVYSWEQGKTKPGAKFLAAIAALRGIGKREVEARLQAAKAAG